MNTEEKKVADLWLSADLEKMPEGDKKEIAKLILPPIKNVLRNHMKKQEEEAEVKE